MLGVSAQMTVADLFHTVDEVSLTASLKPALTCTQCLCVRVCILQFIKQHSQHTLPSKSPRVLTFPSLLTSFVHALPPSYISSIVSATSIWQLHTKHHTSVNVPSQSQPVMEPGNWKPLMSFIWGIHTFWTERPLEYWTNGDTNVSSVWLSVGLLLLLPLTLQVAHMTNWFNN